MNPSSQITSVASHSISLNPSEPILRISSEKQLYDEFHFRRRYISALQQVASEWSKTKLSTEEYVKIKFSEPNFNLKQMSERYSTERISYFTELGLEDKQVYVINGLVYNADLSLYNSSKPLDSEQVMAR